MSTSKWFIEYLSDCFLWINWISFKYMFWEYALYKNWIVIWLICDDTLFIKVTSWTIKLLWENHEKWFPYPKAKLQFIIWENLIEDKEKIREIIDACELDLKK